MEQLKGFLGQADGGACMNECAFRTRHAQGLRDAVIVGATVALLLYAAITAAKSMADVLQPPAQVVAVGICPSGKVAGPERCNKLLQMQLARRDP